MIYQKTETFAGASGAQIIDISAESGLATIGNVAATKHQFDASGPSSGTLDIEFEPIGQTGVWRPIADVQIDFADPKGFIFEAVAGRFRVTPTSVSGNYTVTIVGIAGR